MTKREPSFLVGFGIIMIMATAALAVTSTDTKHRVAALAFPTNTGESYRRQLRESEFRASSADFAGGTKKRR